MSNVKWIKIDTNIFDDEKIKLIEALPSADSIIVIWFKLLCLAGQSNNSGIFMLNDRIAYTDEMLAAIFRRDISTVRLALSTFQQYGMIEVIDDVFTIPNWDKHQTLDAYEKRKESDRLRQQKSREKKKLMIEEKKTKKMSRDTNVTVTGFCSCSLSNSFNSSNTNLVNLNNLVNENSKDENCIYVFNNKDLLKSLIEWMEYKDNKKPKSKNHYDTESGILKVVKLAAEHAEDYGVGEVIKTIDTAIAGGWMGIVYTDLERYGKKIEPKKEQPEPEPEERELTDEEWVKAMHEGDLQDD